jgi:amidase
MLVGIKPTVGRISRYGIIPITADQDTAGPMARTVTDAAILFGVLEGEADPNDPATGRCAAPANNDYAAFLDADALDGARIGIPRAGFIEGATLTNGIGTRGGIDPARAALIDESIAVLRREGATIVDPANIPSVIDPDPARNFLNWPICAGSGDTRGNDAHCSIVFKYGMRRDFNLWLASLGDAAPVSSLSALRDWNNANATLGTIEYGQARIDISAEVDLDADRARYEADRAKDIELGGAHGIDAVLTEHGLDALLFPMNRGSNIAARPGYPSVIVPFGFAPNDAGPSFPDGFDAQPSPFGVTFVGTACSEPQLIAFAYAFEQATQHRVRPPSTP